jgi:hypothetical protein
MQWRIQDLEKGGSSIEVREFLEATPTFGQNHAHFDRFEQPIDPFSNEF